MPKVVGTDRTDIQTTGFGGQYVASVALDFSSSDIGRGLRITSGMDWIPGIYRINSVIGPFDVGGGTMRMLAILDIDGFHALPATTGGGVGYTCTLTGNICFFGNSITIPTGTDEAHAYWQTNNMMKNFDLDSWHFQAFGFGGAQTRALLDTAQYNPDTGTNLNNVGILAGQTNILVFNEWINDRSLSSGTPSDQVGFLEPWFTARKSAGWDKVVIIGSGWSAADASFMAAMNTALVLSAATADGFVNLSEITELTTGDVAYYPDGIHWNSAATALVGAKGNPVLLAAAGVAGSVTSVTIDQGDVTRYGGTITDFTATLVGDAVDRSIVWTIESGPGTTNASTGAYTAPGGLASGAQSTVVRAASNQDPTKFDEVTVTIPIHQAGGGSSRKAYGGHYQPR